MNPHLARPLIFRRLAGAALVGCFCLPGGTAAEAHDRPGVCVGEFAGPQAILLAIDDYALPLRKDLCY